MNKYLLVFLIPLLSIIVGCNCKVDSKSVISDQKAISELIEKYPELAEDTIGNYKLSRTVIVGKSKIGIKLYTGNQKYFVGHNIIVLNNELGEVYAIPLFSTDVRKYWSFENEPKSFKSKEYNSLFEIEFVSAINQLKLNDTLGTGYWLMHEILHSLLNYEQVTEFDGEKLQSWGNNFITSDHHEDENECETRNKSNCEQVLKSIVKRERAFIYDASFDRRNIRIFQFEYPYFHHRKIKKLNMKVYRLGCDVQLMRL